MMMLMRMIHYEPQNRQMGMTESKTETKVVRIQRKGGVVVQGCDVYIGRHQTQGGWNLQNSVWMNPFKPKDKTAQAREECVQQYYQYVLSKPELLSRLHELKGKTLGCWCAPQRCHGDALKYLVDNMK